MKIDFDENSLDEVSKVLKRVVRIKRRLEKQLNDNRYLIDRGKRADVFEKVYNSILTLHDSNSQDLNELYETASGPSTYYVYTHCDPRTPLNAKNNPRDLFASTIGLAHRPFYVGKGSEDRAYDLNRNDSHRKIRSKLLHESLDIEVKIVSDQLTLGESLLLESKLIDIFGLLSISKYGWLANLDEGPKYNKRRTLYDKGSGKILRSNNYLK